MLQYGHSLKSPQEVSRLFGQSFADALFELAPGAWQGPVESSYGIHLIQVSEKVEGQLPDRSLVHDQVLQDLLRERREEAQAQAYEVLRNRYEISITDDAALAGIEIPSRKAGG
jgi:parvulin-like peptidyl-prolyl isomerase